MFEKTKTYHRRKIVIVFFLCVLMLAGLMGRLVYLMVFRSDYYQEKADALHDLQIPVQADRRTYYVAIAGSNIGHNAVFPTILA